MKPILAAVSCVLCAITLAAQSTQKPPAVPIVKVCGLVTREEVKKHLPWNPMLDQFPAEEEAVGNYGSSCNYPSVLVQVIPSSPTTLADFKKSGAN
jgi:hypothetical protein